MTTAIVDTSILGNYMFAESENLQTVSLTNSKLTTISTGAFMNCTTLVVEEIPDNISTIEDYAYYGLHNQKAWNYKSALTNIGKFAFADNTAITSLTLPATITSIGYGAFNGMISLTEITIAYVGGGNATHSDDTGSTFGFIFGYMSKTKSSYEYEATQNGNIYQIPSTLKVINMSTDAKEIPAYAFQNITSVDTVNLSVGLKKIGTHSFEHMYSLNYVEIPITATIIEYQAFINMEREGDPVKFFLIAFYYPERYPAKHDDAIDDSIERPSGWAIYQEDHNERYTRDAAGQELLNTEYNGAVETRWHTKYSVRVESKEIFIYEYIPNWKLVNGEYQSAFRIIGYTSLFRGGQIVVPATYAARPVVEITDGAIANYYNTANASSTDDYIDIKTFEIGINVEKIGKNALPGGMDMTVYVNKTYNDALQYASRESDWIGYNDTVNPQSGNALVYYGFLDTKTVDSSSEQLKDPTYTENFTWTKGNAILSPYQILASGLTLKLDQDDDTPNHSKLEKKYEGVEITPAPIVSDRAICVNHDPIKYNLDQQYNVEYSDNLNITRGDYVATVTIRGNDHTTVGTQNITFTIIKTDLTVTINTSKVFAEEERWTFDSFSEEVTGYKTSNEQIYGSLYTTNSTDIDATLDGEKINRSDGANVGIYNSADELDTIKWKYQSFERLLSGFSFTDGNDDYFKIIKNGNEDVTQNYNVILNVIVKIEQQDLDVFWSNLTYEYNKDATGENVDKPEAKTLLPTWLVPLKVSVKDYNDGAALGIGTHFAYAEIDVDKLTPNSRGLVYRNYRLVPNTMPYTITKIVVPIPIVSRGYNYNAEEQVISISRNNDLFNLYYKDEEGNYYYYLAGDDTKYYRGDVNDTQYHEFKYEDIGQYLIYAILNKPDEYMWDNPIDPLYREDIISLVASIEPAKAMINVPGTKIVTYGNERLTFNINSEDNSEFNVTGLLPGHRLVGTISFMPNMVGLVKPNLIDIEFEIFDSAGNKVTELYDCGVSGGFKVEYPKAKYEASYYEGDYTPGQRHEFVITPKDCKDATVWYSLDGKNYFTSKISYSNAGTYTVYFRIEDSMHSTTEDKITFTVTQLKTQIRVNEKDYIYNGEAVDLDLQIYGSTVTPQITYYMGLNTVDKFDKAIEVGYWKAVIVVPADSSGNFAYSEFEYRFEIKKRDITISYQDEKNYDGKIYDMGRRLTRIYGLVNGQYINLTIKSTSANAGIYTGSKLDTAIRIYAKNGIRDVDVTSNYNITYSDIAITIHKNVAIVTASNLVQTYNGEEITLPTITTTASKYTWSFVGFEEGKLPVNAGKYELVVVVEGDDNVYGDTFKLEVTVNRLILEPMVASSTLTYNGKSQIQDVNFVVNPENIKPVVTVLSSDKTATNVGVVVLGISLDEFSNNYQFKTNRVEYEIIKRNVTFQYHKDYVEWVSDDTCFDGEITNDNFQNIADVDTVTGNIRTKFGKVNIYENDDVIYNYDIVRDGISVIDNYNIRVDIRIAIRYELLDVEVSVNGNIATKNDNGEYDLTIDYVGVNQEVIVSASNCENLLVRFYGNNDYTKLSAAYLHAGTYSVDFKAYQTNFETYYGKLNLTINKITLSADVVDPSKPFDGSRIIPEYTIYPEFVQNVTPTFKYGYADTTKEVDLLAPSSIGSYIMYMIVADTDDYYGFTKEIAFTISKGDYQLVIDPGYREHEYDSKPVSDPAVRSFADNGEYVFEYYMQTESDWTIMNERPVNAGSYKVVVTLVGTDLYETTTASMKFVIKPRDVLVTFDKSELVYNGLVQVPNAKALDINGKELRLAYTCDNSINVGNYLLTVTNDDSNYNLIENSIEFSIVPRSLVINVYNDNFVQLTDDNWYHDFTNDDVSLCADDVISGRLSLIRDEIGLFTNIDDFKWENLQIVNSNGENIINNYEFSYQLYIYVREKPIEFILDDTTQEFTGEKLAPTFEVTTKDVITTFAYDGIEYQEMPKFRNAGIYHISITLEREGYETNHVEFDFIINKINSMLTVEADDKVYDGEYITKYIESDSVITENDIITRIDGKAANIFYNAIALDDNIEYVVRYINRLTGEELASAPVNVGSYRVIVTTIESDNYLATESYADYEITKAAADFVLDEITTNGQVSYQKHIHGLNQIYSNVVYNSLEILVYTTSKVKVEYYSTDGTIKYATKPMNVGSYIARVSTEETDNYTAMSVDFTFEIQRRQIIIKGNYSHIFDSNIVNVALKDLENFSILDVQTGEIISSLNVLGYIMTNAGLEGTYNEASMYEIYDLALMNGSENEIDNYDIVYEISIVIGKAIADFTVSDVNVNYDGMSHGLDFDMSKVVGNYIINYSLTPNFENYSSQYTFINAGVYTVYYYVVFDNYEIATGMRTITINRIAPDVKLKNNSIQYTGSEIDHPELITKSDGAATYIFKDVNGKVIDTPFAIGKYTIVVTLEEGTNYLAGEFEFDYEITKRIVTISWPSVTSFTYIGRQIMPNGVINDFVTEDLGLRLGFINGNGIKVGTHTARAYITNDNYVIDEATETFTFEITPRAIDYVPVIDVVYSKAGLNLNEGENYGIEYVGAYENNVGTYHIQVKLLNDSDYCWSDGNKNITREFTLNVLTCDITSSNIRFNNIPDQLYTGKAITPEVAVYQGTILLVRGIDYELTYSDNINLTDNAHVIIKGINNYEGILDGTFTIKSNVLNLNENSKYEFYTCTTTTKFEKTEHTIKSSKRTFITNVSSQTTITEFLSNFVDKQADYIKIYKGTKLINKNAYDTTYIGTGFKVILTDDSTAAVDLVYVSVLGDVDGDGRITSTDAAAIKSTLKNEYFFAADIDKDGMVSSMDNSLIISHVFGEIDIDNLY